MENFSTYLEEEFGRVEISKGIFNEEQNCFYLHFECDKPGDHQKVEEELSQALGLKVRLYNETPVSLKGLFSRLQHHLYQEEGLEEKLILELYEDHVFISSEDQVVIEETSRSIHAFYQAWGLEDIDLRSLLIRDEVEEMESEEEAQDEAETLLGQSQEDADLQQEDEGEGYEGGEENASELVQQLAQEVPEDSYGVPLPEMYFEDEDDDEQHEDDFHQSINDELLELLQEVTENNNKPKERKKRPHKYLNEIKAQPMEISKVLQEGTGQRVCFQGELLSIDKRLLSSGKTLVDISIYDGTGTIGAKFFTTKADEDVLDNLLKKGKYYKLQGSCNYDSFSKEVVVFPNQIREIEKPPVHQDMATKKRIELHVHSSMSEIDGVPEIDEIMERAAYWGHEALAITDLATCNAYPKAMDNRDKYGLKLLYGMEIMYYDDEKNVVDYTKDHPFHGNFVALDLETTGLRNQRDEIIEVAAVRINNFQVVDSFVSLVRPQQEIPYYVAEITGITNEMVKTAPSIEEVLPKFLAFIGEGPIVAHNLDFDKGFLSKVARDQGLDFDVDGIDTLSLSRLVLRDIKRHGLAQVARKLKIEQLEHHRALDDALVCGKVFIELLRILENRGVETFEQVNGITDKEYFISASRKYPISLLCKDTASLKKLYEMSSISNLNYLLYNQPLVPSSLLKQYREYFLLGSGGNDGWLMDELVMCKSPEDVRACAKNFDYLEIQPIGQYKRLLRRHVLHGLHEVEELHRQILALGDELGIPVVATGDVRYLDQEDYLYRNIVRSGQNKNLSLEDEGNFYFRTTDQMLQSFSHLGERAEEVVVHNTHLIADQIGIIEPLPKGTFPPQMEGSDQQLRNTCYERAKKQYGDPLPKLIEDRLEYELAAIINNGFAELYIIAEMLVKKSLEAEFLVGSRGSVGSSFAATMGGITEVNPLPPHYYCGSCQHSEFVDETLVDNGFDLPDKNCPSCGTILKKDGFNIPFESFMGFEGNKEPDIDLNFAPSIQGEIHKYTEELFGEGHVFKAGTISKVAERTAYGYIMNYFEKREESVSSRDIDRMIGRITGIKRSSGQHPGGIIVVPEDQSIYNFCPIQYPANDPNSGVITTHFDYDAIKGKLLKLDILGHDVPSIIHDLEKMTGVSSSTVRFDDQEVLSIFNSTENLHLKDKQYDLGKGTLGIPEFGTNFVRGMLEDTKPENLADLVRISGLSHGTNVWLNNAQNLVRDGTITIKDVIATREQIMVYGVQMGIPRDHAFDIMERVRKGKGLTEEDLAVMEEAKVPDWYLDSCNKISYMFPKAHAVAYVLMSFRIAYYKVNHPLEFYASYFSTKVEDFDADTMTLGIDKVLAYLLSEHNHREMTKKEQDYYALMEVVYEMYARGYEFNPVDLYKSHAWKFLVEDGKITPPLRGIPGVGLAAAEAIVRVRDEDILSIEDLQNKAKLNRTAVEALRSHGCFRDLGESNQISLFEFM